MYTFYTYLFNSQHCSSTRARICRIKAKASGLYTTITAVPYFATRETSVSDQYGSNHEASALFLEGSRFELGGEPRDFLIFP
jgi:hypothetical protein